LFHFLEKRMDRINALQTFVTIADNKSLTKASLRLGKSTPTVVRVLAELERHLGQRLFNRTTRAIELTDDGRAYLAFGKRILAEMQQMDLEMRGRKAAPEGPVSVTAPLQFGLLHVAPAVTQLLTDFPKLQVRLSLLDRVVDLVGEHVDIAVRIGHLRDSSLIARKIAETRVVIAASPQAIKGLGKPRHPRDLADKPCLQIDGNTVGSSWRFREGRKFFSVPIHGPLVCNVVGPAIEACVAGVGFGRFLGYQVAEHVRSGKLKIVLAEFEPEAMPISLIYSPGRHISARLRTTLDGLEKGIVAHYKSLAVDAASRRNHVKLGGV
jgi:DNA-binding transcriptional LysR family regulator